MFMPNLQKARSAAGPQRLQISGSADKMSIKPNFHGRVTISAPQGSVILDLPQQVRKVPSRGRINPLSHRRSLQLTEIPVSSLFPSRSPPCSASRQPRSLCCRPRSPFSPSKTQAQTCCHLRPQLPACSLSPQAPWPWPRAHRATGRGRGSSRGSLCRLPHDRAEHPALRKGRRGPSTRPRSGAPAEDANSRPWAAGPSRSGDRAARAPPGSAAPAPRQHPEPTVSPAGPNARASSRRVFSAR